MGRTRLPLHGSGTGSVCRRVRRKKQRAEKKARIAAYFTCKRSDPAITSPAPAMPTHPKRLKGKLKLPNEVSQDDKRDHGRGRPTADHMISREDKEISRLEKLMGVKKRKKLPAYFKSDGLDCILLIYVTVAFWCS